MRPKVQTRVELAGVGGTAQSADVRKPPLGDCDPKSPLGDLP